jgi:hypothetical protein
MPTSLRTFSALLALISISFFSLLGHVSAAQASPAIPSPEAAYTPTITPSEFTNVIDNQYWPLKPGTTYVFEGEEGGEKQKDVMSVTFDTKEIMGVKCVVVFDEVSSGDELVEKTYDWYAQDSAGNVWYFGEDSSAYDNGKVSKEGSWEAGVDGALPGIMMPANPKVGDVYRQEYWAGHAEDMAEVIKVSGSETVKYGSFDNVVVTREWSPLEPDVEEQKTYAPGIGNILEVSTKGENARNELVDIKVSSGATPEATPA